MGTDLLQGETLVLSPMEIDAIGEVLNISMGSAATAVSSMLDKQVIITTPKVSVESLGDIDYAKLEPALVVKITYTEGISGSNVMVFSQRDMQLILNQLMGVDDPVSDDFVFDDLSMSAACEIMNQMMGASATALSSFLGKSINISTPTATVMSNNQTVVDAIQIESSNKIVSVLFKMTIGEIMDSEFISVMSGDLAKSLVHQFLGGEAAAEPAPAPTPAAAPVPPPAPQRAAAPPPPPQMAPPPVQYAAPPAAPVPPPAYQAPAPAYGDPMGQNPYYPYPPPPQGYPHYGYPQGYPPQAQPPMPEHKAPLSGVKVQTVQFPEFSPFSTPGGPPMMGGNMDLMMNVPLSVSVEIGSTKRKIKDIMEFNQGSVIELEKQAGAPVDVVVNGQLFARGDVIVVDDNFGVRITEIIGTKELLSSLENRQ
ncbi:MAG: flagellar motor switch phosphatase FliY [Angelakisella sp.]